MGNGEISKSNSSDSKEKGVSVQKPDTLDLATYALRAAGGWKAEAAYSAFRTLTPKMLEAILPALLVCATPPSKADQALFDAAGAKFICDGVSGKGEAVYLINKKLRTKEDVKGDPFLADYVKADKQTGFTAVDEAKLRAYWLFTKANDRKLGAAKGSDTDHEEGYRLAFRKYLSDDSRRLIADKGLLSDDDKARLGPDALKPLTYVEEMRLKALTVKALLAKLKDADLTSDTLLDEKKLYESCAKDVLDRQTWSARKELQGDLNAQTRRQLDDAYFKIIEARVDKLRLNMEDEYGNPRAKDFICEAFTVKTEKGGKRTVEINPGYETAVITKEGIVKDKAQAEAALAKGEGVTAHDLLMYWLLSETGWKGKSAEAQKNGMEDLVASIFQQKEANDGKPFSDKTGPSPFRKKKPEPPPAPPGFFEEWVVPGLKVLAWGGGLSWGVWEAVASYKAVAEGKMPFRTVAGPVNWIARKIRGDKPAAPTPAPSTGPDDASTRLRDDRMARRATGESFKSEGTAVFKALDPSKKAGEAGTKLGKFLTDFAMNEELDARIAEDKLKIEVKFVDAVTATNGMEKGECTSSSRDGVTTLTLTFPKDATPAEIAHDSYNFLFELERSGKGSEKALNRADRAAIGRAFTSLGVDFSTPSDARSSADALPDSRRAATPDPVVIVITEAGVSIGSEKFAIDKVNKAIRDQLEENVKKLDKEGKKAGDADYDDAKKSFDEHDALAKALEGPDGTAKTDAQTKATEKIKTAFEDGNLAKKLNEDIGRTMPDEKGRSRAVVLAMFAARFAAPTAAVLAGIGILGTTSKLRAEEAKRAPIIPIVLPKKQDK